MLKLRACFYVLCVVVVQTLGELRERIDIVHTSEYGSFLLKVFPVLRDLILTRLNPQVLFHFKSLYIFLTLVVSDAPLLIMTFYVVVLLSLSKILKRSVAKSF